MHFFVELYIDTKKQCYKDLGFKRCVPYSCLLQCALGDWNINSSWKFDVIFQDTVTPLVFYSSDIFPIVCL